MLKVIDATYIEGYKIFVKFSNGESGSVDLDDALWGEVFEPLRDKEMFRKFKISPVLHTIQWENDADFAPEYLYEKMIEQTASHGSTATHQ
jgi:hypothetical protein